MIIRIDPEDWSRFNVVQLDSDAPDNTVAVREIENWAAEHGFARTDEYWLRRALKPDGRRIFRGICFRLVPDELAAAEAESKEVEETSKRFGTTVRTAG